MSQALNTIPCISIRQPWAWLIVRPDLPDPVDRAMARQAGEIKDIENRTWSTRIRGQVLIHASKGMTKAEHDDCLAFLRHAFPGLAKRLPYAQALQFGGIIGAAVIDLCPGSLAREVS